MATLKGTGKSIGVRAALMDVGIEGTTSVEGIVGAYFLIPRMITLLWKRVEIGVMMDRSGLTCHRHDLGAE